MIKVAFVGSLPSSFADRIRSHLTVPCDFVHTDEEGGRNAPGYRSLVA